jgi:hypothetical protein
MVIDSKVCKARNRHDKFFEKDGTIYLYLDGCFSLRFSQKYDFSNVELLISFDGVSFPVSRFGHRMTELELAKFYGDVDDDFK